MAKVPVVATFKAYGRADTSGTSYATASITPTAGKLYIIVISNIGGSAADPTSVAGAGCTFTKIKNAVLESGWSGCSVWRACPAAPTTGAITITYAASHDGAVWSICEFDCNAVTGDNGASAIIQNTSEGFGGGTNALTTRTGTTAAFADAGNATVHINARNHTGPATQTPGTGMTELSDDALDLSSDGRAFHIAFNFSNIAKSSPQFTNNSSGTYGGSFVLELDAKTAGGTNYVLSAASGSYTTTGTAATLSWGRKLAANSGAYVTAGTAATLSYGRKLAANGGAYVTTGAAATLSYGRKLLADAGAYVTSGVAATLSYGRKLLADAGAYVYTGSDADLIWTAAPTTNEPGFQPDAFQSDAYQVEWDEVVLSLWEGADIASFSTTATTFIGFDVDEGPDLVFFNTKATTFVTFGVTEGPDVFAFNMDVKTYVGFVLTEGPDIPDFYALTGAQFTFDLVEGPDVPQFRTFTTWWDEGDTFYMYVPYETQEITLTADLGSYILVPAEYRVMTVQNEWKRIDVDQQRARRRETT